MNYLEEFLSIIESFDKKKSLYSYEDWFHDQSFTFFHTVDLYSQEFYPEQFVVTGKVFIKTDLFDTILAINPRVSQLFFLKKNSNSIGNFILINFNEFFENLDYELQVFVLKNIDLFQKVQ